MATKAGMDSWHLSTVAKSCTSDGLSHYMGFHGLTIQGGAGISSIHGIIPTVGKATPACAPVSWKSSQSIPLTELHISAPSRHRMGPDASGGTADTTGAMGMASRKQTPVVKDAKPAGAIVTG